MSKSIIGTIDQLMLKFRRYGELIVSVILFIFFAGLRIFIASFMDLSVQRWSFLSPAVWPGWILLGGAVFSAFLVVDAYKKLTAEKDAERQYAERKTAKPEDLIAKEGLSIKELEALAEERRKKTEEASGAKELVRFLLIIVFTFVYLSLIRVMGFISSTLLFSFFYLFLLKERRPVVLILSPLILVVVIWYVFTQVLVVPLPRGDGFFQEISNFFY